MLIDPQGRVWNADGPMGVGFKDKKGRVWMLPRKWWDGAVASPEPDIDSSFAYQNETEFTEMLCLPTFWDLVEINIPKSEAIKFGGYLVTVQVHVRPGELPKLTWQDSNGATWRLPHNWRRRRIVLPRSEVLQTQGVPAEVAEEFGQSTVSVNYHPGSFCCLPEQYRFRDELGIKWPVRIKDCVLVGYGDAEEHRA